MASSAITGISDLQKDIHTRFVDVHSKIEGISDKITQVSQHFEHVIEVNIWNSNATTRWSSIKPIPVLKGGEPCYPSPFPDRLIKFWRLDRPTLLYLVQFYSVEYVDGDREGTLARLAQRLGLNYSAIIMEMAVLQKEQEREDKLQAVSKRLRDRAEQKRNVRRRQSGPGSGSGSESESEPDLDVRQEKMPQPARAHPSITLSDLTRDPETYLVVRSSSPPDNVTYSPGAAKSQKKIASTSSLAIRSEKSLSSPPQATKFPQSTQFPPTIRLPRSSDTSDTS